MVEIDLYDVLGINTESSEQEIKKAYIRKIKQFPPEQYPEEFKKIRSAYETLSHPQTRREYDTMSAHGEVINVMLSEGQQHMSESEYIKAADTFKKILIIEPSLNYVRNFYALALSYQGEEDQEKAIIQFKKLIELEPDNATYYLNLGLTMDSLERHEEALSWLKKGYLCDPDNVDLVFALVDVCSALKKYQNGKDVLESAMSKLGSSDFRSFILLFKLLQVDIFSKNYQQLASTFARLEHLLTYNVEEKPYVSQRYAKLAFELLGYKAFEQAYYLTEKALELDPINDEIVELHKHVATMKPLYVEYEQLDVDPMISDYLKRIITLYLFGDEVSEEELEAYNDEAFDNLMKASKHLPEEIIKSVRRIIINYPSLYEEKKELLQKVMEDGKYYKAVEEQYEQMQYDSAIVQPFVRLIALYMTDGLTESDRNNYFQSIMQEMEEESPNRVNRSVHRLKQTYPALYQLNPSYLDQIAVETAGASYSSSVSGTNTNHSNVSNSSSCFVATAAYGSPLVEELDFLRLWRDKVLRPTVGGSAFISVYYKYGPYLATIVEQSEWLKRGVRRFIYALIHYLDKKYVLRERSEG